MGYDSTESSKHTVQNESLIDVSIREGSTVKLLDPDQPKIVLYKKRFAILAMFSLCTLINACGWISFAPLSSLLISVRIKIVVIKLIHRHTV